VEAVLDVTGPNAARYGEAGADRFASHFTYEHFRDRILSAVRGLMASER
jgi:hypothetical protein